MVALRASRVPAWVLTALVCGAIYVLAAAGPAAAVRADGSEVPAACGSPNPYVVTTRFVDSVHNAKGAGIPVVFAFRDTTDEAGRQVPLATYSQVGSVYGLAFDAARGELYAAAYMRRGSLFPPDGPGSISRIDLATGDVTPWATLTAGAANAHQLRSSDDARAAALVGKMSLGDIDIDETGASLFAANLLDGSIYRLSIPDGRVLSSFPNGARGTAWGKDARAFGLGVDAGWLYHGVVQPGTLEAPSPIGHVYRSRFDGDELAEIATFPLDADGADAALVPWTGADRPVISDIAFQDGGMVLGIRNLALDETLTDMPRRLGDLLPASRDETGWHVGLIPEHYDDSITGTDESLTGGVAVLPELDLVVAASHPGVFDEDAAAAVWFSSSNGGTSRFEIISLGEDSLPKELLAGSGDLEVLCRSDQPLDPGLVATATAGAAEIATATAAAGATRAADQATAAHAARTAMVPTLTAYAPTHEALETSAAGQQIPPSRATSAAANLEHIRAACHSEDPVLAVAYQLRHSDHVSGRGVAADEGPARHAVAQFSKAEPITALAEGSQLGSVYGLAYDDLRGHLYAAAFAPEHAGPAGPGAIYRIEVGTGKYYPWAVLPATRAPRLRNVGLNASGYGDIELDWADSQLFAVNLTDRQIYRVSVPDGTLMGSFPNGAVAEPWGEWAYPFALGFHDGWLYHGVVPDSNRVVPDRPAIVYRSRSDGSDMSEVARFSLNYGRGGGHGDGIVADIEFRPGGEPILALRDGTRAMTGDVLPVSVRGERWIPELMRPHYDVGDGAVGGALASFPELDHVVSTGSGFGRRDQEFGALWYDNRTGQTLDRRVLAARDTRTIRRTIPSHDPRKPPSLVVFTLSNYEILGDLETLCNDAVPTPTSTPSNTPTHTVTPSPTSTATATATATAVPEPIYLPIALRESCDERQVHADVALVVDVSTSMLSTTQDGRSKLEAVQDAARVFVDLMDFDADNGFDQVALAGFNQSSWISLPLSSDAAGLAAGIGAFSERLESGTRLDLAVEIGIEALDSSLRRPVNTPVIILLTDGLPNGVPVGPGGTQEETVLEAADRARAAGHRMYTIGVGEQDAVDAAYRINANLLRAMATEPQMFFQTLDAAELSRIYSDIAYTLGCPASAFWGRR